MDTVWHASVGYLRRLPPIVRLLALGRLLDAIARKLTIGFLGLYLALALHAGLGQIGTVLALSPLFGVVGQAVAGPVVDHFGRRPVMLLSLVGEGLMMLLMAFAHGLLAFAVLNGLVGLMGSAYWPASNVVVADSTAPDQRVLSYTFLYFVNNIGAAIGPAIGATLAITHHSLTCSLAGAVVFSFAGLLLRHLPDTAPKAGDRPAFGSGYGRALRERWFVVFLAASFLSNFAYNQIYDSLPLYLLRMHIALPGAVYGTFMSVNAILVVGCSLFLARFTDGRRPTQILAGGALLYALSLAGLAFARSMTSIGLVDVFFTFGEMFLATTAGAYIAALAPAADRGVYMGVSSLAGSLAAALAPFSAGLLLQAVAPAPLLLTLALLPLLAALLYRRSGVARQQAVAGLDVS